MFILKLRFIRARSAVLLGAVALVALASTNSHAADLDRKQVAASIRAQLALHSPLPGSDPNEPAPELGPLVDSLRDGLAADSSIQKTGRADRVVKALYIQVQNQLKHVSFDFKIRDASYTHDLVLRAPYPAQPTRIALKKVEEFLDILDAKDTQPLVAQTDAPEREAELLKRQSATVKRLTDDSYAFYLGMNERLRRAGLNAPFPEFGPVVESLILKLNSDATVMRWTRESAQIARFRQIALGYLNEVLAPVRGEALPYAQTIEAIQRTMEFFDVLQRANDPSRSPRLYHSDRYDYYGHFLKAVPDHVMFPTMVSLGATDILKARGVPVSLIGVNTENTWVDGFWQTPYEFWVHDVNHSRRMFQFLAEEAHAKNLSVRDFAKQSDEFVKTQLLPLISIRKNESEESKNKKRLIKVVLFEILHEDALAASLEIMKKAILRPPNLITPFEFFAGNTVTYVMEPGATTLAYVYRKLAHDFYDMPGARVDNIVAPEYRTRERIAEAAQTISKHLGIAVRTDVLRYLVSTDQGFPRDFKQTLLADIKSRPGETADLDQEDSLERPDAREIVAETFHETWARTSAYAERWKIARAAFRDGRGVNDSVVVNTPALLEEYLNEREVPLELRKFYRLQEDPRTGRLTTFEDIRHLPHKFLAPNNQFENLQGASGAVDLIEQLAEQKKSLGSVAEAMAWVVEANETLNRAWLKRNASWAAADPEYNRGWINISAAKRRNGMNLLAIALQTVDQLDSGVLSPTQRSLLQEALKRVSLDINYQATQEVRAAVGADRIHELWQSRTTHPARWKEIAGAKLDDGTPVSTPALIDRYLSEQNIPPIYRAQFELRTDPGSARLSLHENIRELPNAHLSPARQSENTIAAARAIAVVDRIWQKSLSFANEMAATRWLRAAAQAVHASVLERNVNGARDNPTYNQPWRNLPATNQRHDLAQVQLAFEARAAYDLGGMDEAQRLKIQAALASMDRELATRSTGASTGAACTQVFPAPGKP